MILSPNVSKVKPSVTLAVSAKAKAMKAEGIDVISLSAGEPDYKTPAHIIDAAVKAMNEGFTGYTPASGTIELKKAVCEKFRHDNNIVYAPSQIIINCGAKHSDFLAVFVLIGPGDEVIIPSPHWNSYPEMVFLAGGKPVIVEGLPENDMKITAEQLKSAITPKTKLLILNTPSNPSGMMYSKEELIALSEVILDAGIYVISDEIYEKLIYDSEQHFSLASLSDDIYKKTITVNGVSKTYCMTGWRIGFAAGSEEIIRGMGTVQSQETSNPSSISQKGAVEALTGPQDFLVPMLAEYDRRRNYITSRLNGIDGVSCIKPKGAFYVFPDVSAYYGKSFKGVNIDGSFALCDYLLNEQRIAMVPGEGFGADKHVRMSYTISLDDLGKALDRFEEGLKAL